MDISVLLNVVGIVACAILLRTWLRHEWHKLRWMAAFKITLHGGRWSPYVPRKFYELTMRSLLAFIVKVPSI
jgi:hypothetical protein